MNPFLRRWPVRLARVSGPSMVPTLRDGDVVLARRSSRTHPGEVVLARYRFMTDVLVVKRAVGPRDGGWWLASDNPFAGGDSEAHGVADVHGRVLVRWRHGRISRIGRLPVTGA